ncbi:GRAM domain-containing protein 1B [Eumeta japonica]|uniref:GRAM domain-containing protein 1B n=1 Tax=Eumeta variegata TaxID=151549 RepID=A0A4C1WVK8_EUMVA|nr:GRAM domain-containing protein 1B [Eumeta japonica]
MPRFPWKFGNKFPANLGAVCENDERLHKDILNIEKRYNGKCSEEVRTSLYVESCSMEGVGGDDGVDKPDGGEEHVTHNLRDAGEGRRSADDGDAQPTDMSDTSDSEPDDKNNDESLVCNLNHEGRLMCQAEVPINIDQMFTMIFTNSKFNLELLAERGISDYTQTAWQHDVKVGLKCRQIKYTMSLSSGPIGPKEVYVTETQVMNKCSKPGILYSIDATSENAGIPYGDCFSVCVHYCLKRISEQVTSLTLYSQLKYKKSVWPMVKVFLEKNTTSGLDEYAKLLDIRLKLEAEGGAPAKRKGRRRRRVAGITAIAAQETSVPAVVQSAVASSSVSVPRGSVSRARGRNSNGTKWLIACLLVLLAINALLYWRLYISERPKGFGFEDLQDRMSTLTAEQMAEVSRALERHSHAQRDQLLAWRAALHRAVHTLKQTEQALSNLLESIKPSLDKAQQDAVKHPPLRTDL